MLPYLYIWTVATYRKVRAPSAPPASLCCMWWQTIFVFTSALASWIIWEELKWVASSPCPFRCCVGNWLLGGSTVCSCDGSSKYSVRCIFQEETLKDFRILELFRILEFVFPAVNPVPMNLQSLQNLPQAHATAALIPNLLSTLQKLVWSS